MDVSSAAPSTTVVVFPQEVLLVDAASNLHPFFTHRLDAGPIRLTTIAHAFNYRVAVLRDGVRPFPKSGGADFGGYWCSVLSHQVSVMFQIVSALALEVPAFLQDIEKLQGVSPNVQLSCEPWGYADHIGGDCGCLSSDSTGAYVHGLSHSQGGFACAGVGGLVRG